MARREVLVQLDDDLVERLPTGIPPPAPGSRARRIGAATRHRDRTPERSVGIELCRGLDHRGCASAWELGSAGLLRLGEAVQVVARGDIVWADLGEPAAPPTGVRADPQRGRRGAHRVTCAWIMRTIRGIRSEVEVGRAEGLAEASAINCDNLMTVPIVVLDDQEVGRLDLDGRIRLDAALRYALDIQY